MTVFLIDTGCCSAGLVGDVWCGVVFGFSWEFDVEQVGASSNFLSGFAAVPDETIWCAPCFLPPSLPMFGVIAFEYHS